MMRGILSVILVIMLLLSGCGLNDKNLIQSNDSTTTDNSTLDSTDITGSKSDSPNIPYEVRKNISFVVRENSIESSYGKADIIRNANYYSYEIRKMKDGSELFVFYSKDKIVQNIWQLKKLFNHKDFEQIVSGKSKKEDILKIDPYCLLYEKSAETAISEHKLKGNEIANIKYVKKNNEWVVEDIKFVNEDPSKFEALLFQEDLEQIS